MQNIETELNFEIKDIFGLEFFLDSLGLVPQTQEIVFWYFQNPNDPNIYSRIEHHIPENKYLGDDFRPVQGESKFTLTTKKKIDNLSRYENTFQFGSSQLENIKDFLKMLGFESDGSKGKIRKHYEYQNMKIDIDSWWDENFANMNELGTRLEIEGEKQKILDFSEKIKPFVY